MNRSRNSRRARAALAILLAATCALGLDACSKPKPKPPPPTPQAPPPPPPPTVISFDSISQEMKADSRVQFAADLKVVDEQLVRDVIGLSDAIARGDSSRMTRLV